jgi:hypothetical protein
MGEPGGRESPSNSGLTTLVLSVTISCSVCMVRAVGQNPRSWNFLLACFTITGLRASKRQVADACKDHMLVCFRRATDPCKYFAFSIGMLDSNSKLAEVALVELIADSCGYLINFFCVAHACADSRFAEMTRIDVIRIAISIRHACKAIDVLRVVLDFTEYIDVARGCGMPRHLGRGTRQARFL